MKTGIVLEGGGMRGVFTAGVLDYLLEKNIEFDYCIGVSAGACHACSYLSKQHGRAFAVTTDYLKDKRYCSVYSLVTTGNMFGAEMLYEIIPRELYPIDNEALKNGKTKFYAAVTNCETGKAEYPEVKDFFEDVDYVRASSSLPLISKIVDIKGNKYLDGGITDPIPVVKALASGCEKALVVLTQPKGFVKKPDGFMKLMKMKYKKYPKFIEAMENRSKVYNETLELIDRYEEKGKLFVIRPEEPLNIGRTEKNIEKLKLAYKEGYSVIQKRYDEFTKYMENITY